MPRLVYLTGLAMLLLVGAFLLTDWLLWEPGVTERNVRLVKPGVALERVEGLLGKHPRSGEQPDGPDHQMPLILDGRLLGCSWSGPEGVVFVLVDA